MRSLFDTSNTDVRIKSCLFQVRFALLSCNIAQELAGLFRNSFEPAVVAVYLSEG